MKKQIAWLDPKDKLPEDNQDVLVYQCNDSGVFTFNTCSYDADRKRFLVSHLYHLDESAPVHYRHFGDDQWPYYEVKDVDCWMNLEDIHPFH